jgi:hypothetical protein
MGVASLKPRGETILFKMYRQIELWSICKRICTQLHMICNAQCTRHSVSANETSAFSIGSYVYMVKAPATLYV